MVMVPGTPRAVTADAAEPIAEAARREGARTVGVFRNEKLMQVATTAQRLGLDAVQLHGEEDGRYVAALRNLLPDTRNLGGRAGRRGRAAAPRRRAPHGVRHRGRRPQRRHRAGVRLGPGPRAATSLARACSPAG